MLTIALQYSKAPLPISVTDFGISTFSSIEQPEKQRSPIVVSVSEKVTFFSE